MEIIILRRKTDDKNNWIQQNFDSKNIFFTHNFLGAFRKSHSRHLHECTREVKVDRLKTHLFILVKEEEEN